MNRLTVRKIYGLGVQNYRLVKRHALYSWAMNRPVRRGALSHRLSAPLVLSLTSYPPRFPTLAATIRTLLSQTIRPDVFVLWIAHDDWPKLPENVLALQDSGLLIQRTEDLRSYKKIIPAISEYKGSFIVTADDDIYYKPSWLEQLASGYEKSKLIVCHRAHKIIVNEAGLPLPYLKWALNVEAHEESPLLFPTSGGGVLYPPGAFHEDVTNSELFMNLAPTADDLWLYWMTRLNGACFRRLGSAPRMFTWPGSQEKSLWSINQKPNHGNDVQIGRLIAKYGFPA